MSVLAFLAALSILLAEGMLLSALLLPKEQRLLQLSLALPLVALSNVLLVSLLTLLHLPLQIGSLSVGHILIITACTITANLRPRSLHSPTPLSLRTGTQGQPSIPGTLVHALCLLILAPTFLFSFSHAILLPTLQIDSLTNWTMRSQISFVDQGIAFDRIEDRGMAKPQYPFLLHSLQIAVNQGQRTWSDRMANTVTFLLSWSTFTALFLIVRKLRGSILALLPVTLLATIPLMSIHLAQGYGDIHLIEYGLLALTTLALGMTSRDSRFLFLSSLAVAGAMWTKTEGLFVGFLPFVLLLLLYTWKGRIRWKETALCTSLPLLLFLPFLVILWREGLGLLPHERDITIGWQSEGFSALLPSLFGGGSFGIATYVLPSATALLLSLGWKKHPHIDRTMLPLFLWGGLTLAGVLFVYLFTPNIEFLINGQSFFRQMLAPLSFLLLGCTLAYRGNASPPPSKDITEPGVS